MNDSSIAVDTLPLHDLQVDSVGGAGAAPPPPAVLAIEANFGGIERWRAEFTALARGERAGWVVLSFVPRDGTLVNRWVADHADAPAAELPILAFYVRDGGLDLESDARLQAFMSDIHWARVYERYQHAVHEASEPFGASADELVNAMLIDVRRAGMYEQADSIIPGACWHDPVAVGTWAGGLPAGREVVVYCVHGHEVGRATALRLRSRGVSARYLRGGIDGWQSAGRALQAK